MSASVPAPVPAPVTAPVAAPVPAQPRRRHHLVLLQGGRALSPEPFVVAPPAVRAAIAAMASVPTSRAVRMAEADLVRCRTLRPVAR